MERGRQKKLYHWFCILLVVTSFSACGEREHGASDALTVSLELPADEAELFWYGVDARKISVLREGKVVKESTWNSGENVDYELEEGDELHFMGFDESGRLIVDGTAVVGPEKKVSIPLHRIL
jgi:hypothetical protein